MRGHLFPSDRPSRRAFLVGTTVAVAAGAGGGYGTAVLRPAARPAPLPEPPAALVAAIRAERRLVAELDRARIDSAVLARLRADHVTHGQALQELTDEFYGVTVPESGAGTGTPTGSATAPAQTQPLGAPGAGAAERAAAAAAARRAGVLEGRAATLLASIAACEAGHAVLLLGRPALPPEGLPSGSASLAEDAVPAWQAALAAEQQAVFGYAVLGPQLRAEAAQLALALQCSNAHEQLRDETEQLLAAAATVPVAPKADYPQLYPVRDATAALALALRLENDCVSAWRYAYATSAKPDSRPGLPATTARTVSARHGAQQALTAGAVRALRWRLLVHPAAPSVPFPGL